MFNGFSPRTSALTFVALFMVAMAALFHPAIYAAGDGFLDPEKAFVLRAEVVGTDKNTLSLRFKIAPGYYMYRERFEFVAQTPTLKLGEPIFPRGQIKYDPTFDKEMELYFKDIEILLPLVASTQASRSLFFRRDRSNTIKPLIKRWSYILKILKFFFR